MQLIIVTLLLSSFSSFAGDYYFIGGEYNSNIQPQTPMKVKGLSLMGPSTSTFWETEVSGSMRQNFANELTSKYMESKIQLLPTHVTKGDLKPTQWVSNSHAFVNLDTDIRMGAIINSVQAKSDSRALKIESAKLVTLVKNPKNNQHIEFSAPVDMKDLNLGSWKSEDYRLTKASAKMVDPSDLVLPKKVVSVLGDVVAKFAKKQKMDSSDLESKLLIRMKFKKFNGEEYTIDYLLSDNNYENLNLLKLRGVINALGGFSAARTLNDLVGSNCDLEVYSTTLIKPSTLAEGNTIIGSED